jgi:hypothetical protein
MQSLPKRKQQHEHVPADRCVARLAEAHICMLLPAAICCCAWPAAAMLSLPDFKQQLAYIPADRCVAHLAKAQQQA